MVDCHSLPIVATHKSEASTHSSLASFQRMMKKVGWLRTVWLFQDKPTSVLAELTFPTCRTLPIIPLFKCFLGEIPCVPTESSCFPARIPILFVQIDFSLGGIQRTPNNLVNPIIIPESLWLKYKAFFQLIALWLYGFSHMILFLLAKASMTWWKTHEQCSKPLLLDD